MHVNFALILILYWGSCPSVLSVYNLFTKQNVHEEDLKVV